ncbi:hypothetical protein FM036_08905 [Nostoc sp. HG1]|nr:hypothetical protein [Nostoc sp. HG1]
MEGIVLLWACDRLLLKLATPRIPRKLKLLYSAFHLECVGAARRRHRTFTWYDINRIAIATGKGGYAIAPQTFNFVAKF